MKSCTSAGNGISLGIIGDDRLGGEHHSRDTGRVLKGGTGNLYRVHNAPLDKVAILARLGVKAPITLAIPDMAPG